MKKTVSIQISGMLFHVDDDAYAVLDEYLQSIRAHFAHLADRDEIVSDIESRIAETFSEKLKKSKQTVTMKDVETLMEAMGTVEDFEAFEADTDTEPAQDRKKKTDEADKSPPRRFYRNPEDKVIAGVASGIASYFNIDPVIIRVIFVVLGFMHGIGVIAYVVLWIAMPLAKTHSERMEMQGQPMTLSGLEKKIQRSTQTFETENFTSVFTRGGIKLHIREGKEHKVAARGSPHDLRTMDIHVVDGQLRIERIQGSWLGFLFHGFRHLSFDITLPDLKEVDVAGACAVEVDGFHGKEIRIQAKGASTIRANTHAKILHIHVEGASSGTITGEGETIFATAIGASSLNARQFKAAHGHADISGASSAHVYAEKTVDGHATGASSLCVYGAPTVTAKASGASSVQNRDGKEPATDEWHQKDIFYEQKKYSDRSPVERFFLGIGRILRILIIGIFQVAGVLMSIVTGVLMMALIFGTIIFVKTGSIPYSDISMGFLTNSPLFYIITAVGFMILFVPLVILSQIGGSLVQKRRIFSLPGLITLVVLWFTLLMSAFFIGQKMLPHMEYQTTEGDTSMQSFSLNNFQGVHADGTDRVQIKQGKDFSILARGTDESLQSLVMHVENGTLQISHPEKKHCFFCQVQSTTIDISMPALSDATFSGLTQATIDGFSGSSLRLSAEGLAKVVTHVSTYSLIVTAHELSHFTLSGTTDLLDLTADDLSRVDADDLSARQAVVSLHDLSHTTLTVSQAISGTTNDLSRLSIRGSASDTIRSSDMSGVSSDSLYDERLLPTQDIPSDY